MKQVSMIIPVYNAQLYLTRCIDSLVCQKGIENCQLFLIDDASTDGSAPIIHEYSQKYNFIVPLYNKKNLGPANTLNRGLDLIENSEYIWFGDNDDIFGLSSKQIKQALMKCMSYDVIKETKTDDEYLQKMLDAAMQTKADITYSQRICSDGFGSSFSHVLFDKLKICDDKINAARIGIVHDSHTSALYDGSLIKNNNLRFDPRLSRDFDILFTRRATYYANKVACVPNAAYFYNIRGDSICGTFANDLEYARAQGSILETLTMHYALNESWSEEIMKFYIHSFCGWWKSCCKEKKITIENCKKQIEFCDMCKTCKVLENIKNMRNLVSEHLARTGR